MNLKKMSSLELLQHVEILVKDERRISTEILLHLSEIEYRKAYAETYGCKSLYEYATRVLKYSSGAAARRISAMYALRKSPELGEKIESGALNVCKVSRIETFVRKEEKLKGEKMPEEEKAALFVKAESLSQEKLERVLVDISPQAAIREFSRPVSNSLFEIRLLLTEEQKEKWEKVRGWIANSLRDPSSSAEAFMVMLNSMEDSILRERTEEPSRKKKASSDENARDASRQTKNAEAKNAENARHTATPMVGSRRVSRFVPISVQRAVFRRAELRCEHISKDGSRCGSTHRLEIHHIVPFARGGGNDLENLSLFCSAHNLVQGFLDFGEAKMNEARAK